MKICLVKEIRELDKKAVAEYGIPAEILMENAGQAVYQVIRQELGTDDKKLVVLCGPGNNGGDGFVVARHLYAGGASVKVFILADRTKYRGAANKNLEILTHLPIEITDIKSAEQIRNDVASADGIVDALLGTGLDREVDGILRQVIELVNQIGRMVFAIDIPSGINGDTGQEMGMAIKADDTVTFGLPKLGNLLYPGYGNGGTLYVSHISYPRSLSDSEALKIEIPVLALLPKRRADTSKMDYGPALVIAGAASYFWAPHASAYAFLKAGGGYVFLACPASIIKSVARQGREVVFQPQAETRTGSIAYKNKASLLELANRMKIVVIGPGLSLDEETQQLVRELSSEIAKPLLIDGDGITAIAKDTRVLRQRQAPTIITPHSGEMGRITGQTRQAIEKNRVDILQAGCAQLNAYIVLKGPRSLIGSPDGRVFINVSGDTGGEAGMATAGSGDVLNGTIAALFCLGMTVAEAVRTGVFIHGLAGDLAAREKGPDGMTARDILNSLPGAVKYYRRNLNEISLDYYGTMHTI